MCRTAESSGFLAMDARHCAGAEMADLMAYWRIISRKARLKTDAIGFVGCAADATAHFFDQEKGMGAMPHALVGYAGSTVEATECL